MCRMHLADLLMLAFSRNGLAMVLFIKSNLLIKDPVDFFLSGANYFRKVAKAGRPSGAVYQMTALFGATKIKVAAGVSAAARPGIFMTTILSLRQRSAPLSLT